MSDLTFSEKKQLESLFGMKTGYVLDFSDRTFSEFVSDSTKIDILSDEFKQASGSKAHRLRAFWHGQPNRVVGKLVLDLCEYVQTFSPSNSEKKFLDGGLRIGRRLSGIDRKPSDDVDSSLKPLASHKESSSIHGNVSDEAVSFRKESALLLAMFDEMTVSDDPHRRGYLLQDLLNRTLFFA